MNKKNLEKSRFFFCNQYACIKFTYLYSKIHLLPKEKVVEKSKRAHANK